MSVAPPEWRRARSWDYLRKNILRIVGVRVRMANRDAFSRKARHRPSAVPAAAFSAMGELESVTHWRPATLLGVGEGSISVELVGGGHLNIEGLDGFEILLDKETPKKETTEDEEARG